MWEKNGNEISIPEVVRRNTNIPIDEFLHPSDNPYLDGLDEAVDFIRRHDEITVIGDYDADGVTSCAILYLVMKSLGKNVHIYIPKRFSDGYGISQKIIEGIHQGAILTVDNGIAGVEAIDLALNKGLPVFVVDHHLVRDDKKIPNCGILDPHINDRSEFSGYCGAGLSYRITKELTDDKELLDKCLIFASIGTVADVMELTHDNRNIVRNGLKALNEGKGTVGIQMLKEQLNIELATETDYGFSFGPVINASGRLHDDGPMDVFHFLVFDEHDDEALIQAKKTCEELIKTNIKRQDMVKEQMELINPLVDEKASVKVIYHPELHTGIVGILAGKIEERTHCPSIVFTKTSEGILKGSGRSSTVHLKNLLDSVSEYLYKYGGHAGAAGLSIQEENLTPFTEAITAKVEPPKESVVNPTYDLEIRMDEIPQVLFELERYAPFGEGNPNIKFYIPNIHTEPLWNKEMYQFMGKNNEHVKVRSEGVDFLMFDKAQEYSDEQFPAVIDCIGYLSTHQYHGFSNPQLEVLDFKLPNTNIKNDDDLENLLMFY